MSNIVANKGDEQKNWIWLKLLFFVAPLIVFMIFYVAYYPGNFSYDSIEQYGSVISNKYNDWHPVMQTLFAFKLPLTLSGGRIGSIVLFQILLLSGTVFYSLCVILKYTNAKYAFVSMLFILMNPLTLGIAMYPWKDVSFGIGALLLLSFALHIIMTDGEWIKKKRNLAFFVIAAVLTTLFRHNAILFTAPLIFAVAFYISKKRAIAICLAVLLLLAVVKGPVHSALNVEKPDERKVEILGMPMTIIGAVVTHAPESLDEKTLEFAYKVSPKEEWEKKYSYGSYNSIKYNSKTDNSVIEEYGNKEVLKMTLKSFISSPVVAFRGLFKLTDEMYSIFKKSALLRREIYSNDYGIVDKGNKRIANICASYTTFVSEFFPYLFLSLGVVHYILIASVLGKCKTDKPKDKKYVLFVLPVFIYNFGTMLLLTGSGDIKRFFWYTFLIVPTLLVFIYGTKKERGANEVVRTNA